MYVNPLTIHKLVRQWNFPICNACTRWALSSKFRHEQEIKAKLGVGGQTIVGRLSETTVIVTCGTVAYAIVCMCILVVTPVCHIARNIVVGIKFGR